MKKQENWKKTVLKRYKPSTHVANILVENDRDLCEEGCKGISDAIDSMEYVKQLTLEIGGNNKMTITGAAAIGKAIGQHANLTDLSLRFGEFNGIEPKSFEHLFQNISPLTQLNTLDLFIGHENEVSDNSIVKFREIFKNSKHITILSIHIGYFTSISNTSYDILGQSIATLHYLRELSIDIGKSSANSKGIHAFAQSLKTCKHLVKLSLSLEERRQIGHNLIGVQALGQALRQSMRIQALRIEIINFDKNQKIEEEVIEGIIGNKNLHKILYRFQSFSKEGNSLLKKKLLKSPKLVVFQEIPFFDKKTKVPTL